MVAELTLLDKVFDFMASAPSPREILAAKTSQEDDDRVAQLLDRNRNGILNPDEARELDRCLLAESLMIRAKAVAFSKIDAE